MSFDAMGVGLDELSGLDLDTLDGNALTRHLAQLEQWSTRMRAAALAALGEFEHRGLHLLEFAPTTKAWLTAQVGISAGSAAGQANLARKLRLMPLVRAALLAGRISEDHARMLMRCLGRRTAEAFDRDEALLVAHAEQLRADDFDKAVQRWLLTNDPDGNEPRSPDEDEVSLSRVGERYKLNGDFGLEQGAELDAALREKVDELFRRDRNRSGADPSDPSLQRSPAQRRAEALADLVGLGAAAPSNTRRRKPLLMLIATENPDGDADFTLHDGSVIPASVAHIWGEDGHLTRAVFSVRGELLDVGRAARIATEPMRHALIARDGPTCAVPGCDVPAAWCDAHHIIWWRNGGTTRVSNLVLLCRHHHRRIHHRHLFVHTNDIGEPFFTDSMGRELTTQKHRHPPPPAHAA